MATAEIHECIRLLLDCGIHFVPRSERDTPEGCAEIDTLLNRALRPMGHTATVTLDRLGIMIVLDDRDDEFPV
jgi:hypothetical protein